jgi:hypothetical protein
VNASPYGEDESEREEQERRTLVNLLATIALLVVAIAAVWLIFYLEARRELELCLEAGRRDCLERFDAAGR